MVKLYWTTIINSNPRNSSGDKILLVSLHSMFGSHWARHHVLLHQVIFFDNLRVHPHHYDDCSHYFNIVIRRSVCHCKSSPLSPSWSHNDDDDDLCLQCIAVHHNDHRFDGRPHLQVSPVHRWAGWLPCFHRSCCWAWGQSWLVGLNFLIIIVVWPRWPNFSSLPKMIVMILATISSLIFSIGLALFASGSRRALSWTPSPRFFMIMIRIWSWW